MGRTEPCVLYAHTFVHPHLDEYVDEVLFSEPVVITACEFLEQNASSLCPAVKLIGATSPPSFALEVFIQCEGETRFRRLCMPCLYSHSSSNVLEVEALVTNHLVVRGSYRSLSMVIYGNTAEDLGQFNIEVDLDSSLTDTASAIEGNLEDLPPAFHPTKRKIDELVFPSSILNREAVVLDVPVNLRRYMQQVLEFLDSRTSEVTVDNVLGSLLSVAASHKSMDWNQLGIVAPMNCEDINNILTEVRKELSDVDKKLHNLSADPSTESAEENLFLESEAGVPTSKYLLDILQERFELCSSTGNLGYPHLSKNMNTILWLSMARLLCSGREGCSYFVNYGGMKQLGHVFTNMIHNSITLTLLLLGLIEQATRHSIGCEGFLGWWPRETENIPSSISDGYNQLLKLLLENQRHDVASLTTYILHRMRFYEVSCKYEFSVLSILGSVSAVGMVSNFTTDMLTRINQQLKTLLKLIKLSGPIDDPSPSATTSRYLILGDAGQLTYKATSVFINLSKCCFSKEIDCYELSLLKDRGFLPLSAALLSSSILRSEIGQTADLLMDILLHIETIVLLLLFCRAGLAFLLNEPDVFSVVIHTLCGTNSVQKEDSVSLRHATVLISKGFYCQPKEVAMIIEMHARAVIAVDNLSKLTPNTEEFLWVLWDLCRLSRSECGRQALLVLVNFPEAMKVLVAALYSGGELDPLSSNNGLSPLNLAIFHSTAEILEVIVTDSTATSLLAWIDHAKELHRALHSSSPGSNMKDAPARLLEWIDAGVVYHRNGAIGLLQYAAVLTSGGDAHMASNSVLASDMMEVDNIVGDFSSTSDGNIVDNLIGKRITEKDFPGIILRDSVIAQLTTAFRILAFISDNKVIATALYDEGAVMVVHAVLINCKLMLERSSNIYDYLVDEGIEGNSTSDLLLERSREKSLFDLLIVALVLLINLLQNLKGAKEQHRNSKLMNVLLQLHREVSPKLAACSVDLSQSCPDFSLGYGAVCHLLASALACWPVYGWTPGLFHFLLDSLQTTSLLVLGPKETCSLLCLLMDLFPDETIWLWKNGRPRFSFFRALAVGTILGSQKEQQINWYMMPGQIEKLVAQLSPQVAKLGEIILHCAISMSMVVQDILRVFIIRIAFLNIDNSSALLKPLLSWISLRLSDVSILSDTDIYKVHQLLNFLVILLEHPHAKPLLFKEGGFQVLMKTLEICIETVSFDMKQFPGNTNIAKQESSILSWCIPVFKSLSLMNDDGQSSVQCPNLHDRDTSDNLIAESCFMSLSYLLKFTAVLPVGRELLACLSAFEEIGSATEGQNALLSIFTQIQSSLSENCETQTNGSGDASCNIINGSEWLEHPPLLCCWNMLLRSISFMETPIVHVAEAIEKLSLGTLKICMNGESLDLERVSAIKFLFGVKVENPIEGFVEESFKHIEDLESLLGSEANVKAVKNAANLLLLLLQSHGSVDEDSKIVEGYKSLHPTPVSSRMQRIADRNVEQIEECSLDEFGAKFGWDCPENLRDRLSQTTLPAKRKISMEGPNRRARGDVSVTEATAQSSFSRGSAPVNSPSGPTRRDNFRQRKPNTSRPPSMHVDDYVARERNADGTNSSNVITVPRIGSSSGRPPSIHVDEFMARQRERQSAVGISDAATQVKTTVSQNMDLEKSRQPRQLKPDLDDDLQGIDIVFDAEESEPDDKLPFPQPDDTIQPTSVVVEQRSPHSIVEETESDANEVGSFSHLGTPLMSNTDDNLPSDFSSRISASRPEMSLTREPSISSEKKFSDQLQDSKALPFRIPSTVDSSEMASSSGVMASVYTRSPSSTVPFNVDTLTPPYLHPKVNLQQNRSTQGSGSQGYYDQKFPSNQPPLPPMPPPPNLSPRPHQNMDSLVIQSSSFVKPVADMQTQGQSELGSVMANSSISPATNIPLPHAKYGRTSHSSPSVPTRPPPLPLIPPPYPVNTSALSSLKIPTSQSPQYFQSVANAELQHISATPKIDGVATIPTPRPVLSSYPPSPLVQPLMFRTSSMPANPYSSNLVSHHGDNLPNFSHNLPVSIASVHSIPTLTPLQPLQPPLIPRPPPQHIRPPITASQPEHGGSLSKVSQKMQAQSSLILQTQESLTHTYYQAPQQDHVLHASLQQQGDRSQRIIQPPGDGTSLQQDPGSSLQEYFRSPEAIQSLLSDRDKLCQLLEQHPKLMQMLQERLGRL